MSSTLEFSKQLVTFQNGEVAVQGYLYEPIIKKQDKWAIITIPDVFGFNRKGTNETSLKICLTLGCSVLLIDPFRGKPFLNGNYSPPINFSTIEEWRQITLPSVPSDIASAIPFLKEHLGVNGKIGVMGFVVF